MKTIVKYTLVVLLIGAAFSSNAQLIRDLHKLYHPSYFSQSSTDTSSVEPWKVLRPSKPNYSFEVGSTFSSYGGGFSSTYFSPSVSFMATERLLIVAGGKFSYANFNNMPMLGSQLGESPTEYGSNNPTEAFAYGNYQVNSRLSIYGMGAFGKNQIYFSPFQSGFGKADYQQLQFGMDYKISDRVSLGASFGYTNGPAWGVSPFGGYRSQPFNPFFP